MCFGGGVHSFRQLIINTGKLSEECNHLGLPCSARPPYSCKVHEYDQVVFAYRETPLVISSPEVRSSPEMR